MSAPQNYPDFAYSADQLNKFIATADIVTIMLKNGHIIHHTPQHIELFIKWLVVNGVKDIKARNDY